MYRIISCRQRHNYSCCRRWSRCHDNEHLHTASASLTHCRIIRIDHKRRLTWDVEWNFQLKNIKTFWNFRGPVSEIFIEIFRCSSQMAIIKWHNKIISKIIDFYVPFTEMPWNFQLKCLWKFPWKIHAGKNSWNFTLLHLLCPYLLLPHPTLSENCAAQPTFLTKYCNNFLLNVLRVCFEVHQGSVHTVRVYGPSTRPVFTGVILDTCNIRCIFYYM